ncbi:MoaD family protein [Staphylothermus marinus F1]|uniref:MoaD family protein n=1 Tax=Staphylothermus marinus (strain ATCC 43588 / DSM 3639 / JCM 9404 / F1) TaxID=399550 RepID=A3DMB2_STAMF|nr:MoaD family protein [Staphylothermus marinus]ABN69772.1 MoaD family protein [Staphylothermus marinus F1]
MNRSVKVKIKVYMTLPETLGWKEKIIELPRDKSTFRDLLDKLEDIKKIKDDLEKKGWRLIILVNGKHIEFLNGMDTVLNDGDEIAIFPPAAGG